MSSKHNIENIFKETFESFTVKPSNSLWNKINKKLLLNDFLRFVPGKFNIYYTAILVIAASFITYNINLNSNLSTNAQTEKNHEEIINTVQENDNTEILIPEENNIANFNNTDIQSPELNIKENNIITNTELYNNTNKTAYFTEEESNNEENIIEILAKPYADFTASNNVACEPAAITFNNASENCDRYLWDFGNGKTSSLKNPTFVFKTAGTFIVKLTVFSGSISNSADTKIIINKKPDANFEIKEKTNLFKNETVYFTNTSSDFYKSVWKFGNGNSSNSTHPQHTYDSKGSYNISLICLTDENCADTSFLNELQIKDNKYKITAPTASYCDINGANSGHHTSHSQSNTIFYPIFNYDVAEYRLRIYNKSGVKVFESNNYEYGWNGYYNYKPAETGVYIWECSGKFKDGENFRKTGNLTLLYSRN